MSQSARVKAQAKINLLLRVLAREESGYHSIETVFLRLDLSDDIRVSVVSGRSVDCTGPSVPPAGLGPIERNLAYRAALAYADATGWPDGFAIEIEKRIPVGGGLGGGSADAGAVLRVLDALSPRPLGPRLAEVAGPLGADVPFMSLDRPMALAWGHGERLFPLRALPTRPVVLVVPPFAVSTADAYGWVSADRVGYQSSAEVIDPAKLATWEALADIASNDFEPVVGRRHEVIEKLVAELRAAGARVAMLSGSGSTVFGVFDDASGIAEARARRPDALVTATSSAVASVEVE